MSISIEYNYYLRGSVKIMMFRYIKRDLNVDNLRDFNNPLNIYLTDLLR